jgi:L-gulonate 5-dehydrogenase
VEPFIGCGTCHPCRTGKPNCCANLRILGIHCDGGFAEHVGAPAVNLHVVPENLSLQQAAFAEPLAIGVQACRRGEVAAGDRVLILGAGPIGLATLEVARSRGAEVWITDINRRRLDLAASLGGMPIPADGIAAEVNRLTAGEGMPVVIEATGAPSVIEQTIGLVAAGGRIVIVGLAKQGETVTLPALDLTRKEVTMHGSRASTSCIPEALGLLASGIIRYTALATFLPLDQAPETFALLARDHAALDKAVFSLSEAAI